MILYFTGTGNSRFLAKKMAEKTGYELFSINSAMKMGTAFDLTGEEKLVFIVPTYAWRMPHIVEDWIRKNVKIKCKAYFIMNCGDDIGGAAEHNKLLCQECGFEYMGTQQIRMPENYIAMFDCPSEEKSIQIANNGAKEIENLASAILAGKALPDHKGGLRGKFLSGFINWGFNNYAVGSKKFRTDDRCIGCGKCVELCPTNNITLDVNRRPVWKDKCTHCMACICYCPGEAIEYGKTSVGKRRYRCPGE